MRYLQACNWICKCIELLLQFFLGKVLGKTKMVELNLSKLYSYQRVCFVNHWRSNMQFTRLTLKDNTFVRLGKSFEACAELREKNLLKQPFTRKKEKTTDMGKNYQVFTKSFLSQAVKTSFAAEVNPITWSMDKRARTLKKVSIWKVMNNSSCSLLRKITKQKMCSNLLIIRWEEGKVIRDRYNGSLLKERWPSNQICIFFFSFMM